MTAPHRRAGARSSRRRIALVVAVATLLLAGCGTSGAGGDASAAGSARPAFVAATLTGGTVRSASFAGKPTVLWFWAPWCTTCRAEAPDVAAVARDFAGEVDLIGVAGRGEVDAMKQFVDQTGTDKMTHVIDDDGGIWSDYGVAAQPAFAFIDADGRVDIHVGAMAKAKLEKRMRALAAT